jgi:hypothetical protein
VVIAVLLVFTVAAGTIFSWGFACGVLPAFPAARMPITSALRDA